METPIADRFAEANPWKQDESRIHTLWTENDGTWEIVDSYLDAYEAMTPMVRLGNAVAVLEMFGSSEELDEDENGTGNIVRVRLLFTTEGDYTEVVMETADGDVKRFGPDESEGMFPDLYRATRDLLSI